MASAFSFTLVNGYLQAGALGGPWASAVPGDAAFGGGLLLFLAGALGNAYHDALLRSLRLPGETGYKIPVSGLFEYVSGANYLCEIVCGNQTHAPDTPSTRLSLGASPVDCRRRDRRVDRVCLRLPDARGPNLCGVRRVQPRAPGSVAPRLVLRQIWRRVSRS